MTRESRSAPDSETARRTGGALAEVARLLARSLDPGVVARLVADSVRLLLGGQPSVVDRLGREWGSLVAVATSGDPGPGFGDRVVVPPGAGSVGVAIATRGRIRAARLGGEIFLVALTGYGQPEDHGRSRDAGFDAHLVKPVGPADLARIFTRVPRRRPAP